MSTFLAGALLVVLSACGDPEPEVSPGGTTGTGAVSGTGQTASGTGRPCLPGQVDPCDCGLGVQGTMTCNPDGLSYGPCACPSASGTTGTAPSATAGPTTGSGGVSTGDVSTGSGDAGHVAPLPDAAPAGSTLASGVRIAEVALYQAVKVPLARAGEPVAARNAPVIVGKEAFLRVFVEPLAGPREVEVELTLSSGGETETQTVTQQIAGASSDPELGSTVNFDIEPGAIAEDTEWSVALREPDPGAAPGTVDPGARFPSGPGTTEPLGARNAGPLRVMIVPYRYMADGSGRLPELDDAQLERFRSYLYAYYPITEIEFEMHEPVEYTSAVGPQTGWERWLDNHCALRTSESPDPKVLYYGLMSPRPDARSYGGGVYGISYLPGPAANYGRCSVGVGFGGDTTAYVMAHELGHGLGLPHAPCGVEGGPYPYRDALIGSWGFGLSSRTLKNPDEFYDMMSYCDPTFISDYNFQKLFERVRYLNLQFKRAPANDGPQKYVRILEPTGGSAEVVGRHELDMPPGGDEEKRSVELVDAGGVSMGTHDGYFLPFATGDGGTWFVPDVGADAVVLEGGERVSL